MKIKPTISKNEIKIKLLTRLDTRTDDFYYSFMDLLIDKYPQMMPEFYDWNPKCKAEFEGVEEAKKSWAMQSIGRTGQGALSASTWPNFLKRDSKVKNLINVSHYWIREKDNQQIFGSISMWATPDRKLDWVSFFRDMTKVVQPILGRMHISMDIEMKGANFGSPQTTFWAGPSQPEIRDGVTNLAWANFFGDEFAQEVDEARLCAHGYEVESICNGKFFRVTASIFDILDNFPKFSQRRAELKSLFRPEMFLIADEPSLID